jgi:hypothetical protein
MGVIHPVFIYRETGLDLVKGKATFGGSGDYKVSWTTREDTARYLGYVFTHLTASELSGKALRFEGDNMVIFFPFTTEKSWICNLIPRPSTKLSQPTRRKRVGKSKSRAPLGRFWQRMPPLGTCSLRTIMLQMYMAER